MIFPKTHNNPSFVLFRTIISSEMRKSRNIFRLCAETKQIFGFRGQVLSKIQTNVCIFVDKRGDMCYYNMQTEKEPVWIKFDRKAAMRNRLFILFYEFRLIW